MASGLVPITMSTCRRVLRGLTRALRPDRSQVVQLSQRAGSGDELGLQVVLRDSRVLSPGAHHSSDLGSVSGSWRMWATSAGVLSRGMTPLHPASSMIRRLGALSEVTMGIPQPC